MEATFFLMTYRKHIFYSITIISLLILTNTTNVFAQFDRESHVDARLISEVKSVKPGSSFWVAVQLTMNEGWHTYWRNPGDSGLETQISWQLPDGFTAGEIKWPYPERIIEEPLVIYGYHNTIYLLSEISVDKTVPVGEPVFLKANVSWLECAEVCIPGDADVKVRVEVKNTQPELNEHLLETFSNARAELPILPGEWKITAAVRDGMLTIQAAAPEWYKGDTGSIWFFPYKTDLIENTAEQMTKKDGSVYHISIPLASMDPQIPDTLRGILLSEKGWRGPGSEKAMEILTTLSQKLQTPAGSSAGLTSIWLAVLFSFLGGMILNLMPCVLPVLSIKIMGFVKQANEEHSKSWQHGVVFTLGVLISFWVLAILLLIFKAGGAQLGWGFQLQSPAFLIILSSFMFLFGLSMFGVFEIGTSLTTVAGKTQGVSGFGGSFVSGVTATIVATPCTAPFMGSALGFALTQPAWVSLLVFTFIGLGMSAPYMLVTSIPALLKFVPKPGRWMESLKEFMGFLLVATVIWLLWVLGIQAGASVVILVLFALLITAVGGWIYGRWGNLAMPMNKRIISTVLAVILILSANIYALANVDQYAVKQNQIATNTEGIKWEPYSAERIAELKQAGKPIFIDFTAAWCLSCQVNEQVAFSSEDVQNKFKELGIRSFKADWTSRDEKITQALADFGRNSVPLYVLYSGKSGSQPEILPEIITPGIVLDALKNLE
jgi:thiol:disulfide interchange protein/DsbC/DsbD-like thiol-disulfide interchange protein